MSQRREKLWAVSCGLLAVSVGLAALASCASAQSSRPTAQSQPLNVSGPTQDYQFFVASEGNDHIALVRYGPSGATVERQFRMGTIPTELVGPHGLGVSPDGKYYYVSTAHGTPFGALWKFTTVGDTLKGRVELGSFPATLQVSPNGAYVYVVNFNLHGDMVPSSVSIVYADEMIEVARLTTCTMPHGSRLNAQGTKHYSACMMDDMLVEIDARNLQLSRHFMLGKGKEHGMAGAPVMSGGPGVGGDHMSHGGSASVTCSPTWAQPSADGAKVYVACNKSNEIVEVDVAAWTLGRRLPAGDGVYNLAASHDGRLLVGTNKRGQSVSVFEVATGKELARIPSSRRLPSGVAISSDDRYAFVTVEGVGAQPGTVDIIDLKQLQRVASVDVGQQAGGIDFWRLAPVR
ncbi:MAG TPA: YncE family protein [Gemmatimonadaceae bacterium]|nr:YncE family protein [Gemmatimonadaceae bacterium]